MGMGSREKDSLLPLNFAGCTFSVVRSSLSASLSTICRERELLAVDVMSDEQEYEERYSLLKPESAPLTYPALPRDSHQPLIDIEPQT
jgi:hypothetical protein